MDYSSGPSRSSRFCFVLEMSLLLHPLYSPSSVRGPTISHSRQQQVHRTGSDWLAEIGSFLACLPFFFFQVSPLGAIAVPRLALAGSGLPHVVYIDHVCVCVCAGHIDGEWLAVEWRWFAVNGGFTAAHLYRRQVRTAHCCCRCCCWLVRRTVVHSARRTLHTHTHTQAQRCTCII